MTSTNELSCCDTVNSNSINENEQAAGNEVQEPSARAAELPYLEFTNEKGNVRVKERKLLRDDMLAKLDSVFAAHPYSRQKNVNGGFSLCLGIDRRTGHNIWAHIELTVNDKDPDIDSWSGRKRGSSIEVPQLF